MMILLKETNANVNALF